MMLIQKSNPDDRKMTNDCYVYSDVDGSTAPTTTTTTDTAAYHHTNTDNLSIEKKKRIITKQRHFLLCESCFWCASSIYLVSMDWICPVCNNSNKIESIPIQNNEIYKFDYNQRYGVILEFSELVV
jgi:rubrerythrin